MKVLVAFIFFAVFSMSVMAQGRKMPPFSFQEHSIEFADANRSYSQGAGFTQADTLGDEVILASLAKILELNPELQIQLVGHTALNERTELGMERAQFIRSKLVEKGIDENRLSLLNEEHNTPLLSDEIIMSLPSKIEKDAANERNRRVEVRVASAKSE
jgi:hypothetical protein